MRGLGGGMDHELDRGGVLGEHALDRVPVADVELERDELVGVARAQRGGRARRGRVGAEEPGAHVVLDADRGVAELDEAARPTPSRSTRPSR